MEPDGENWLAIPAYEGCYEVSDLGRIRNVRGDLCKDHPKGRYGHRRISLFREGRYRTFSVHRLVLVAFKGPAPPGMQACHVNGDASDNRLMNLRWDTPKANQADRKAHGTAAVGTQHPFAKLTESSIVQIRALSRDGLSSRQIASRFGVSRSTISRAVAGKHWRHVA